MTTTPTYTTLESFLLARSLGVHGTETAGLAQVATFLQTHPYVKADPAFNPERLTPDALLAHFKALIAEEWSNPATRVKGQPAPVPTLEEVKAGFDEKYPALVNRLYNQHSQNVLRAVREDERRLSELAREIRELELAEAAEKARAAEAQQPQQAQQPPPRKPTPANETQPPKPANGRGPSPGQTPVPVPTPGKPSPPAPVQQTQPPPLPPPRNVAPAPPGGVQPSSVVPPAQAPAIPPGVKAQQATKPPGVPGQVLQPPMGAGQPLPPRGMQSTSPVPLPAISPRPDPAKPKTPGPPPPAAQQATPGTLKWEKPYQPPATTVQGRPVAPQIPAGVVPAGPIPPGQPQPPAQWQQPPGQQPQGQQPGVPPPHPAPAQRPTPVLMPPQAAGQFVPPPQVGAGRGAAAHPQQGRAASTTPIPAPVVPPVRTTPSQPQGATAAYQNRPLAAAIPTQPPTTPQPSTGLPPPRWPQQQPPPLQLQPAHYTPSQFTPTPPPTNAPVPQADGQRRVGSPYTNQPPRPALPPHIASQVPGSPSPVQRPSSAFAPPKTPVASTPTFVRTGSGTKWTTMSTVSTPAARPSLAGDFPSPAYEPLSPVRQHTKLPGPPPSQAAKKPSPKPEQPAKTTPTKETKVTRSRGRPPRLAPKDGIDNTPSRSGPVRRSQSVASQIDELSMDDPDMAHHVKNEESTPRPHDEAGDTTADESGPGGRRHRFTPGSVPSRHVGKRKRQETPPEPLPPASTPTHVLWTRQFGKISSSALDQISSHRCANQFAHPIRERDAPGYRSLVLQPQDIKSIRAAMTHGNRAAMEAAKALPDGDPGTATVWLPISEELLPPKSIINSEQLERELVHMFSNAIMYNLDPYRGPGKSFVQRDMSEDDEEVEPSTYLVDEDAVVRDSRIMFVEVERLLGDLRAAERERSGLPPSATGSARPTSLAATPAGEAGTPSAHPVDDDIDELAGEDGGVATVKRRRIGTRA